MKDQLKKVVVLGPESTGKSTLCKQLAEQFNTTWVDEYAREYLLKNGTEYTYNTLLDIARGQLELENKKTAEASKLLIIDTNMYVMKVWCEYVFGKCHDLILKAISGRKYDLYLLCKNDLPWVKDELREYPDDSEREKLFQIYFELMDSQEVPYIIIEGDYDERFQIAVKAVSEL